MKTLLILSVAVLAAGCSPGWVVLNQNSNKELGGTSYAWVGCHVVTKNPSTKGVYSVGIGKDLEVGENFYWKQVSPDGTVGPVETGKPC